MTNSQNQREAFFTWEAFLMGGLSILVCLGCWAFLEKSTSVFTMSQLAFSLAFLVNHPHFLSSYTLLYGDFRKNILKKPKYFWAAVIVPVLLLSLLGTALMSTDAKLMGHIINAMFFLVGWHYTKQIFGCVIVTSARRKMYFTGLERKVLLSNLFSLWSLSFLRSQAGSYNFDFYGITYSSYQLPAITVDMAYWAIAITGAATVYLGVRKYINEGRILNSSALMALGAIYVWYLPMFAHPHFAYLIPFFHSLQYLVFVWSFKKNQVSDRIKTLKGREMRAAWVNQFVMYLLVATGLGALSFEFLPKFLDAQNWINNPSLGTSPMLAATLLFINIHHYFIDNVIWRSQNEEIKKYLFASETELEQPKAKAA